MSRQQLESIFIMPSTPMPGLEPALRAKNLHLFLLQNILKDLKNSSLRLPQNLKHLHLLTYLPAKDQNTFQARSMISVLDT